MTKAAGQWLEDPTRQGLAPSGPPRPPAAAEAGNDELIAELARVAHGDQAAFERFYDATLSRVFGVVRRFCIDPSLAEEVVEDVYVQVWRDAARFDASRGVALAWLLMLARSRALDALRRIDPALVLADPHGLAGEPAEDSDPLGLLESLRRDSAVREALATLPARERQMIALAFFRGLTHVEIAAAMHCPLGTVKTAIRRALGSLRARLGDGESALDEEFDDDDAAEV